MKSTLFRDVVTDYQAFEREATSFIRDSNRRLAQEDDLSEATLRSFESHLSRLLKAGARLERAIRRLPDPSCVPQELRDRLQREQAQSLALISLLRTAKGSGAASKGIPAEVLR